MKTKLLKKKNIIESTEETFKDVTEAGIDADNNTVSGVCLFGTDISKNGRKYETKAIDSLTALSEGVKCFINHPTKSDIKERDGVRNLSEWVGVFSNARRDGNKVFADLKCREAYFDLVKDIALLQPRNVGNSINAMVKVSQLEDGMESVVNVEKLRSVDLVSSAATCISLFESAIEKAGKDMDNDESLSAYESIVPVTIEGKFSHLIITEGIIQDKLDNDKLKYEINDVTYIANDLIREVIYKKELSIGDKKKKVMDIFSDLDKEIVKRLGKLKKDIEEGIEEMEFTIDDVKKNKEIMEALFKEFEEKLSVNKTLEKVKVLEESVSTIQKSAEEKDAEIQKLGTDREAEIKGKDEKITALESELRDAKLKLDEIAVVEKRAIKKAAIDKLISESELPKEAVTDLFMETLMTLEDDVEGEEVKKSVEEKVKAYIADRLIGIVKIEKKKGSIKDAGEEFVDKMEAKKTGKTFTKEELKDAKENFEHNSK
uniref:Uncharacterized protein n=1 Tax=viral metagenome TaxID=1070528 RepID=A0A6M3LKV6_9ZZZZ